MKITTVGEREIHIGELVKGIENDDYHKGPGVSKSMLDIIDKQSAAHLAYSRAHPRKQTPAMLLGTVFHSLLLEPATFHEVYTELPEFKGKGAKANREAFEADIQASGHVPVKSETLEAVAIMAANVRNHPMASAALDSGEAELSGYYVDKIEGCLCRFRPDFLSDSMPICVDIKTAADASLDGFARSAVNFNYPLQDAMYRTGLEAVNSPVEHFVFLVVENTPPYSVAMYELDDQAQQLGLLKYKALLAQYAVCEETNIWPSYPDTIRELSLPSWAYKIKDR